MDDVISPDRQMRFAESTTALKPGEWLALGLLASEFEVTQSALHQVLKHATAECINRWLEAGFINQATDTRRAGFARREPTFALVSGLRSQVLRRVAGEGQLALLEAHCRLLAQSGSLGSFIRALFAGDITLLETCILELSFRISDEQGKRRVRRLLREALCSPFDANWLQGVWKTQALALAEQVLADALDELEPVGDLYAWALHNHGGRADLCRVLLGHALLRGEPDQLEQLAGMLPVAERQAVVALCAYLGGRLDATWQAVRGVGTTPPNLGALAPLVALLLLGQPEARDEKLARSVLRCAELPVVLAGWPSPDGLRFAAKSLNQLLRNLRKPENQRARQSVHQLPARTPAWQLLLLALDVSWHEQDPVTRKGWAKRLDATASSWHAAGYPWLADQARLLAQALDPSVVERTVPGSTSAALALCDLLQPEPEWRKSLQLLAKFVNATHAATSPTSYRVAWFVDMAVPRFTRPALEEFRALSGWTQGRRVHLDELLALIDQLPPEDRAVLRSCEERFGSSELGPNAFEALIGHPRVYNGARGRLPIEVVRGECRVEAREEHGHLLLAVEPAQAAAGVNIVVESEQRLKVVRVRAVMAELIRVLPETVRVPVAQAHELLPVLGELALHLPVHSEAIGAHRRIEANSKPCLRISPEAGAFCVEIGVRPFGATGRFFPPGHGRAMLKSYAEGELLSTERKLNEEVARARSLVSRCPTLLSEDKDTDTSQLEPSYRWFLGEERLCGLLMELRKSAAICELEWQNCRPLRAAGRVTLKHLTGRLRPTKGWYLATGGIRVDGHAPLDLSDLVCQPFTKGGRFLRLPSGDYLEIERRLRQVLNVLAVHASGVSGAPIQISPAALGTLEALTAGGAGFDVDESIKQRQARVRAIADLVPEVPAGFQATLRPYQREGYQWLWRLCELGLGACLADDMGLGKTIMASALLLQRARGGPALVVAPTSVCSNWLSELGHVAPGLKVAEYAGKKRMALLVNETPAADVLVTSYAFLQQDADALAQIRWNTLIIDEAQFIKNAHSARAKAVLRLSARARVAITGTPVENHLGDLWSIFHFLNPTLLGPYKQFFQRFLRPIERDKDEQQRQALRQLIRPLILRRTKQEVLSELPPITTLKHEVELSHEEALRYALLRRQIHEKLRTVHGNRQHKLQVLAEITRLRRFCCHPRLVFPDANLDAAKLEALVDLVEELRDSGHRALVFSQFVDFLNLVRERLDEQAIPYQYLDGACTRAQRQASVAAFQAGSAPLFLISLKAGGFGLNLTAADYVIQLDPWWNPAVEAQASDRAHRIGQVRPVTVYRLVTKHTIEERIDELQESKRVLAQSLLDGTGASAKLSGAELERLLS